MHDQLYDIYEMWHTPFWQTQTFLITALLFLLVFLGSGIVFLMYLRKKKYKQKYWECTLAHIDALGERMNQKGAKHFYFELTSILKKYFHKRFGAETEAKTDQEFVTFLSTISFPASLHDDVQNIFSGSMYIKFANAQALDERMKRDFIASKNIIKKTIPPKNP